MLVLNWRVQSDGPLSPREADNLFSALVLPALADAQAHNTVTPATELPVLHTGWRWTDREEYAESEVRSASIQ